MCGTFSLYINLVSSLRVNTSVVTSEDLVLSIQARIPIATDVTEMFAQLLKNAMQSWLYLFQQMCELMLVFCHLTA